MHTEDRERPDEPAPATVLPPFVIWFTGLSGSGKTTLAQLLRQELLGSGRIAVVLDGDVLRQGLNADLGFSPADRDENIRRVAAVARLLYDAGLVAIVACIAPRREHRAAARSLFPSGDFIEVSLDASLEVCELRDVKGLYRRARTGAIANFTGIDAPYEAAEAPELSLPSGSESPDACIALLLGCLRSWGLIA